MKLFTAIVAVLLFATVFMPGITSSQDSDIILRVAIQNTIYDLNPFTADYTSWKMLQWIYDGPMNANHITDELTPYVAVGSANISGKADSWDDCAIGNFGYCPDDTWQNSSKPEAIIFYDFTNVLWHDGTQMTVRDIMFSYHAWAQDGLANLHCLMDGYIAGIDWNTYPAWDPDTLHISKVWEEGNRAALKFELQEPYSDFFVQTHPPALLPYHIWGGTAGGQMLDGAKIWCDAGYNADAPDAWSLDYALVYENNPPIGSGIFKFQNWDDNYDEGRIDTNREHFYSADYAYKEYAGTDEYGMFLARQPFIDAITFKVYKTAEYAVLALKDHDIDYIAFSIPPTFLQELSNEPGVGIQQSPEMGFSYVGYNMRRESFGYDENGVDVGKPLRQAIAHCIDKQLIVQRLLLNMGISSSGPVYPTSEWYNSSIPTYDFNPDKAKQILAEAGYKLTDGSINSTTGLADVSKAADSNWWLNPDGTPIGSSAGGLIEILSKEANYDPISASKELMIAQQLRDIGIYAQAEAMDVGTILERVSARDFDIFVLDWTDLVYDPTDYLYDFFHSSQAEYGQNYPGYQNKSFDETIDLARSTGDYEIKKQSIFDAQAAICYDLPIDVLYFRTNIEAYRSDSFIGWESSASGSIFNWVSIMNIRAPSPNKVVAKFLSVQSAVVSNSTTPITIEVTDQNADPLEGARVVLSASLGTLDAESVLTDADGRATVNFTAPYSDPNDPDAVVNGTGAFIQIESGFFVSPEGDLYDPAPGKLFYIRVFPVGAMYISVTLSADPNVLDPDVTADGTPGLTYVDAVVRDQSDSAVQGASVKIFGFPIGLEITPEVQMTDANGVARFTVYSTDLPNNDSAAVEFTLRAIAIHPDDANITGENSIVLMVIDANQTAPTDTAANSGLNEWVLPLTLILIVLIALFVLIRRKRA